MRRDRVIDLDLVETLLLDLDEVAEAAVVAAPHEGAAHVVAWVVPAAEGVTGASVRHALGLRVTVALVPTRVHVVAALPRTASGAIDHPALDPEPGSSGRPAPTTELERRICHLWSDALAIEVGRDDDLHDLGGSFALAVRTTDLVEGAGGAPLPASALLRHRTPAAIAAAASQAPGRWSTVTVLQDGDGVEPPLVIAYDLDGSSFTMAELAAAIDPRRRILGLDSPLRTGEQGPTSLVDLAATHVADLLEVQPDGPHTLLGYSFGAFLAYEMGVQLASAGHEVALVGMVDLGPVHARHHMDRRGGIRPAGAYHWRPPSDLGRVGRARAWAEHLGALEPARRAEAALRTVHLGRPYDLARARIDLARGGRIRPALRPWWNWHLLMDAAIAYPPNPYRGRAALFLCEQTAKGNIPSSTQLDYASKLDLTLGWGPFAPDLEVWPLVGHHTDLIEPPYVEALTGEIRRALAAGPGDRQRPGPVPPGGN